MKDKISDYIRREISSDPTEEIGVNEDLFGGGIVDSIGMIKLITYLQEQFDVSVTAEEMTVENFMTVQSIINFLSEKQVPVK
jgi:acyl carrier protein